MSVSRRNYSMGTGDKSKDSRDLEAISIMITSEALKIDEHSKVGILSLVLQRGLYALSDSGH